MSINKEEKQNKKLEEIKSTGGYAELHIVIPRLEVDDLLFDEPIKMCAITEFKGTTPLSIAVLISSLKKLIEDFKNEENVNVFLDLLDKISDGYELG